MRVMCVYCEELFYRRNKLVIFVMCNGPLSDLPQFFWSVCVWEGRGYSTC